MKYIEEFFGLCGKFKKETEFADLQVKRARTTEVTAMLILRLTTELPKVQMKRAIQAQLQKATSYSLEGDDFPPALWQRALAAKKIS